MRDYLITWTTKRRDRKHVLEWVFGEWDAYADKRNDPNLESVEQAMQWQGGVSDGGWWFNVMAGYLHRAEIYGLETPKGRQQMMKACTTVLDMAATMIRVYGEPPKPGEPS